MKNVNQKIGITFFLLILSYASYPNVNLPALISNGMVLQRDQPILTWGWADAGENINLNFNGKVYKTVTAPNGKWKITLPAMNAGGPYNMTINGKNSITINNILIGEVWLCSGQSNMEFTLMQERYPKEVAESENQNIRQFLVKRNWSYTIDSNVQSQAGWQSANPQTVQDFTAVGYFFAKEIWEKYKIPIGIINSSLGATPIEAWMSEESLSEFPKFIERINLFKDRVKVEETLYNNKSVLEEWYKNVNKNDKGKTWMQLNSEETGWKRITIPEYWEQQRLHKIFGAVWFRKEIDIPASFIGKEAILKIGTIIDDDVTFVNGIQIGTTEGKSISRRYIVPPNTFRAGRNVITIRVINRGRDGGLVPGKHYEIVVDSQVIKLEGEWKYKVGYSSVPLPANKIVNFSREPSVLYNTMIAGLIPYTIKGILWYQGENNVPNAKEYQKLFPAMIADWRKQWGQGNFPFLFVQLAGYLAKSEEPQESTWAELREAQRITLAVPNTAMAVAHDIGEWNDIHPLNKEDVGKRLSLAARHLAYGEKELVYSGPLYKKMTIKKNQVEIRFTHRGSGLMIKGGMELKHFAVAGSDQKFIWANARVKGKKIIVWNDKISNPLAVRYAWASNPEEANLYNREGLPASSFRTDKWIQPE